MNRASFLKYLQKTLNKPYKYSLYLLLILIQSAAVSYLEASSTACSSILINHQDVPIIKAVQSGDTKKVESLIKSGIDVNASDKEGRTLLMIAACTGNIKMLDLLISKGARLESYDDSGNTAFMYAFFNSDEKDDAVKFLLSKKVDIETMNNQEQTPLILAALNGHCKSMLLLIEAKAKLETKGKLGRTALMSAIDNQCVPSLKLLVKHTNIETRDSFSFTPFLLAVFYNNGSMMRILLETGCNSKACTTADIPITKQRSSFYMDYFNSAPKESIKKGSNALDIAKQFECRAAENILTNYIN